MAPAPPQAPALDAGLLQMFQDRGFFDAKCHRIVYGETAPSLTRPGEREFQEKLRALLLEDPEVWGRVWRLGFGRVRGGGRGRGSLEACPRHRNRAPAQP
jgi:hypothetical protein